MGALNLSQNMARFAAFGGTDLAPEINHRPPASYDAVERRLFLAPHLPDGGPDDASAAAEFAPVRLTITVPEQLNHARRRHQVARDGREQRGFPRAIRPEHHPMFTRHHPPVHVL